MNQKTMEHYELAGDKLFQEGKLDEAERAYRNAQDDAMLSPSSLEHYKRLQQKIDKLTAAKFDKLCKLTKMKKKDLADLCDKTAETFYRYCSGDRPIPTLVYEKIEQISKKIGAL
jgi:hypothetical protein